MIKIAKIIAGGQTGADRGALDAAISLGIPHGGFCPKGRRAEDGVIPEMYDLIETKTSQYDERTELNVLHSDATLIFIPGRMSPGSNLTKWLATQYAKPCLVVDVINTTYDEASAKIELWLRAVQPVVLNGAGTRESKCPGMQKIVADVVKLAISRLD